jgi:hypothetical protein
MRQNAEKTAVIATACEADFGNRSPAWLSSQDVERS